MSEDMRVLARGREADVFDRGDGTVLRRYRDHDVPAHEVRAMRHARSHGYSVPEIIAVSGRDLVLDRVSGPTMQEVLLGEPGSLSDKAAQLAGLHHRLHHIAGPDWLPSRGEGDRLLHLDLHPKNVILGVSRPVVIDWSNCARGPAALDPALAIAVFVTAKANVGPEERLAIDAFIDAFASHFAAADLHAALPLAFDLRRADRNVTDIERAELAAYTRNPRLGAQAPRQTRS
jgi:tRNA A-37 threonylcarbamoyl transferase component Bud32